MKGGEAVIYRRTENYVLIYNESNEYLGVINDEGLITTEIPHTFTLSDLIRIAELVLEFSSKQQVALKEELIKLGATKTGVFLPIYDENYLGEDKDCPFCGKYICDCTH